jgi:hypothetical protein
MYNLDKAVIPLNFKLNLTELEEYYLNLKNNYDHLHWTWEKNKIHLNDDALNSCVSTDEVMMHGWSLQSDMEDPNIPPSMLRSKHPRVAWYDTELMFGILKRLKEAIPFAYRWTLFILPAGAKVVKHTDIGEYAVHIPLYWDNDAVFIFGDHPYTKTFTFPATGDAYLVDAEIPHATSNNSSSDRIGLVCRIKRDKLTDLLKIKGTI